MKLIVKRIFLFGLPLLFLFAAVMAIPIDKRHKYEYIEGTCYNHGLWIHDRIFLDKRPIDIAILGSSHSVNGINDALISQRLLEKGKKIEAANLAYCMLGRNLSLVLLKDLLKKKNPAKLLLEVREDEDRYSHKIFSYIGDNQEVFLPSPLFNPHIIRDGKQAGSSKLELLKQELFGDKIHLPIQNQPYGHSTSPDTVAATFLAEKKERRMVDKPLGPLARNFYMTYPRSYLKKIHALCQEKGIELQFLYIPAYGTPWKKPKENATYAKYGTLLMPPKEIFQNTDYWKDENHLNTAGATVLSEWLALQLLIVKD